MDNSKNNNKVNTPYLKRLVTSQGCEISPLDVDVLSLIYFRDRKGDSGTKTEVISDRLNCPFRSVERSINRLKSKGLIRNCSDFKRKLWVSNKLPGWVLRDKRGLPVTFEYKPSKGSESIRNANRLFWWLRNNAGKRVDSWVSLNQSGIASFFNISRITVNRLIRLLRSWKLILFDAGSYLILPPTTEGQVRPWEAETIQRKKKPVQKPKVEDVVKPVVNQDQIIAELMRRGYKNFTLETEIDRFRRWRDWFGETNYITMLELIPDGVLIEQFTSSFNKNGYELAEDKSKFIQDWLVKVLAKYS